MEDWLGTLVNALSCKLQSTKSWEDFIKETRDKPHLSQSINNIQHPARPYLQELLDLGVEVHVGGEPWSQDQLQQCLDHGAHQSVQAHSSFVRDELADNIESGFWVILPFNLIKDLPNLHLSPLGLKEELLRWHHLVADHTFFGINQHMDSYAPETSMMRAIHSRLVDISHMLTSGSLAWLHYYLS